MNVERIIVETNDETCNNPVEYDWEFDPDGVSRMTGEGDIPSGADDSTAIVEAFGHIAESIVDGERIASGGDAKWLFRLLLETAKSADIPVGWGT